MFEIMPGDQLMAKRHRGNSFSQCTEKGANYEYNYRFF